VRCGSFSWRASLPDGPTLFSLRPEQIRLRGSGGAGMIHIRCRVVQSVFHGATELMRVECPDGIILLVRTATGSAPKNDIEIEFAPGDAVVVSESPERV
jgi:TOBE domain